MSGYVGGCRGILEDVGGCRGMSGVRGMPLAVSDVLALAAVSAIPAGHAVWEGSTR